MTDRRSLWSNGEVAHSSLRGQVDAKSFADGVDHRVTWPPLVALRGSPTAERDRELLWGQTFCVLDVNKGFAFGFARADGYTGYVEAHMLQPVDSSATHRVCARQTVAMARPVFKDTKTEQVPLSLGSEVIVRDIADGWARVIGAPHDLFVPAPHLAPLDTPEPDPVSVAERLLGTPYVWGGNSAFGIDCSGLVQIACRACGIPCPGDSDQQAEVLGETLDRDTPPKRGDLFFWRGHVTWIADEATLLHANAHHMAVAFEPLTDALDRIAAQGDGMLLRHARLK
ncbi:NlpC/P60 family protein [Marivita hallyeonensis]|uniref:NlpC/P60 family protein n=1 Tax=Marivita hallyeonensis TaxID=996342 RepID=A0A1M5TT18_9RHOB|nr:NlpC/P60 family protein [Marivita hallyeonensis]SHH53932.1 NlpC/P60 family protein [Marivita hallyeonensis]